MTGPTRTAGQGIAADGAEVTWTVAEGRRGRRWREVVSQDGAVIHALLLETGPDGHFSHLELARADGLWTFHPETDGTLHGNRVGGGDSRDDLVRHAAGWAFRPGDVLLVVGSPISLAAIAWRLAGSFEAGETTSVAGVLIDRGGTLEQVPDVRIERLSATRWRIGDDAPFEVDVDGLPVFEDEAKQALELG
jgi:hypothetical protein